MLMYLLFIMFVWTQAHQEIPEWLDALANDSYGSGGFTHKAGQFRDARRGRVRISFSSVISFSGLV